MTQPESAEVICTATSVVNLTVREALHAARPLRVPVFQRKYCWRPQKQLAQFLEDVLRASIASPVRARPRTSLGRCVVAAHPDEPGASMLIDGQQRLTTCCLLISAIRDRAAATLGTGTRHADDIEHECVQLLFCTRAGHPPGEGARRTVAALTPTYFDRESFRRCLRADGEHVDATEGMDAAAGCDGTGPDHLLEARRFFDAKMDAALARLASAGRNASEEDDDEGGGECGGDEARRRAASLLRLLHGCCDACTLLYFRMRETGQDVHNVYIRLAMREAMLGAVLSNSRPGCSMNVVDLARGLVCGQFSGSERAKVAMYLRLWAPTEQLVRRFASSSISASASSSASAPPEADAFFVESLAFILERFVESERPVASSDAAAVPAWMDPGQAMFPVYSALQSCILRETAACISAADREAATRTLLLRLYEFAKRLTSDVGGNGGALAAHLARCAGTAAARPRGTRGAAAVGRGASAAVECRGECRLRGTLCVSCIVKQATAGRPPGDGSDASTAR